MSPEEWAQVDAGDVLIRVVTHPDGHKVAQAITYLDADPLSLFDRATDSAHAREVVDEVREVEVLEKSAEGKLFRSTIEVSFFLPKFHYTVASSYLEPATGQCWSQVEGDFERNEGTHSFLWDPVRKQTLAIFTFVFELRGLLGLIPEATLLKRAGRSLEAFMRRIEALVPQASREDPVHAAEIEAAWAELRPRLEAGGYPGRVWLGYPPPAAPADVEIRELDGAAAKGQAHDEVVAEAPPTP